MSFGSFIKKQFIDVIQWNEDQDGVLAWRYPMQDFEIQNGAALVVRESQVAVFVNEGVIADVFEAGTYKLTTQTLPLLTNLKNWDKLFESPFKSDVYFFSKRIQLGRKWGTPQPVTVRDSDFGMVRIRAFGIYSYQLSDPKTFFTNVSGTKDIYTADQVEQQLRNLITASIATALGQSGTPFLDMAANQGLMADNMKKVLADEFNKYGLTLENFAVESINLPDDLQQAIDKRIRMGMMGDLNKYTQFQTAESIPLAAQNEGGIAGLGASMAAGLGVGQIMADNMARSMANAQNPAPAQNSTTPTAPVTQPTAAVDEHQAKLSKLKVLLDQGLISSAEYDSAKATVLKQILGE